MHSSIEQQISKITKSTAEVIGQDFVSNLAETICRRPLVVYWGTATTGVPHYGYFIPLLKIKDLLESGCKVKVLIADLHSLLDAQKSKFDQLQYRTNFYTVLIKKLLVNLMIGHYKKKYCEKYQVVINDEEANKNQDSNLDYLSPDEKKELINTIKKNLMDDNHSHFNKSEEKPNFSIKELLVSKSLSSSDSIKSLSPLTFVLGSSFQLSPSYNLDKLRLESLLKVSKALRASSEVVKQQEDPEIGSLTYPLMQALDEEYLGVDMQIGGLDQRKILMLARLALPMLGYKKRLHMMTEMLPSLSCEKYEIHSSGIQNKSSSSLEIEENNEGEGNLSDLKIKPCITSEKNSQKKGEKNQLRSVNKKLCPNSNEKKS